MLGQTPEEAFANPGIERAVLTSWERFLSGAGAGGQVVRPAINDSWRRSQKSAVDYRRSQAPMPMNDDRLHRLLDNALAWFMPAPRPWRWHATTCWKPAR